MVCIQNCAIGTALVVATIFTSLVSKQDSVFQNYIRTLEPDQIVTLNHISDERMTLYIQGTILGVILVALLSVVGGKQLSPFTNGCAFVVIVLLTQYFYYILMPKSDWMLKHLRSQEQNVEWLNVYRHMSLRWHLGLVVGLLGFFLLGRGLAF